MKSTGNEVDSQRDHFSNLTGVTSGAKFPKQRRQRCRLRSRAQVLRWPVSWPTQAESL
jgi:hypothetical protein